MRQTLIRAAAAMPQTGLNSARHMALLPPIPLYRRLLRAHRKHLPPEARLMGDLYIKAEFRAHRNVDNPAHLVSPAHSSRLSSIGVFVVSRSCPRKLTGCADWIPH